MQYFFLSFLLLKFSLKLTLKKLHQIYILHFFVEDIFIGEGAFFNERAHFCNTNSTHCFVYHSKSKLWLPTQGLSTARAFGAFALLPTQ
jgi:hypothetical protein